MKGYLITIFTFIFFVSCSNENSKEVIDLSNHQLDNFSIEKYLGLWDEVVRTDNRFEKDLINVSAHYFMKNNKVRVINRGWNTEGKAWKEAIGYIKTTDKASKLKVSFFRPFYGDYNILYIDKDYKYSVVGGKTSGYFWILKIKDEKVKISKEQIDSFIEIGKRFGYDTNNLIIDTKFLD